MTSTVPRAEYERLHYFGAAGPVSELGEEIAHRWQHEHADWKGRYWRYTLIAEDSELMTVEPVNVSARSKGSR
ncbi:hypothetical protein [Nocardia miyunensis]|uniref:hypothetical protein n=1 Tax=Nocardia miyunensis TaxID=282684 RepID=UPI000A9B7861|nr:hypothetical protein [Nocardia miyunensis]